MKKITAVVILSLSLAAQAQDGPVKKDHHIRNRIITVAAVAGAMTAVALLAHGSEVKIPFSQNPGRVIHGVPHGK